MEFLLFTIKVSHFQTKTWALLSIVKMSDKLNKKRERGANYTTDEKSLMVHLITQYKDIVDDKCSGGQLLMKKREAWRQITDKYNSNCTTGIRQTEQLKALYDNMKQKSRKSVGESKLNKNEYIMCQHNIQRQMKIENDEDEDTREPKFNKEQKTEYVTSHNFMQMDVKVEMIEDEDTREEKFNREDGMQIQSTAGGISEQQPIENDDARILAMIQEQVKLSVATAQKRVNKPKSAETLKRIYFKRKCENARLERRKLINEISYQKREHNLKMIILKKRIDDLYQL